MALNSVGSSFDGLLSDCAATGRVMRDAEPSRISRVGGKELPGKLTAPGQHEFLGKTQPFI